MKITRSRNLELLLGVSERSIMGFLEYDMLTYAAALAYRALFALFPFFAFLIALFGFLEINGFFDWLIDQARSTLQEQYAEIGERSVGQSLHQAQGGLLTSASIIALWSVSGVVRSLTKALNKVHEVHESRPVWKRIMLQLSFALGLAPTIILVAILLLVGPRVIEWIVGLVGLDEVFVSFGHGYVCPSRSCSPFRSFTGWSRT